MILAETFSCGNDIPELARPALECTDPDAGGLEQWMRLEQWRFDRKRTLTFCSNHRLFDTRWLCIIVLTRHG